MKAYRLGNDIFFRWTITGLDEVSGQKAVSLYNARKSAPETISYEIEDNVVRGVFRGKDQHDQGVYRLLLQVNGGEDGMVTLDKVDVFALHGVCAFGIVSGEDDPSLDTLTVEIESDIHSPTYYQKPGTGIPKSDLAADVKASLEKADRSLQHVKTINGVSMEGEGNIQIDAEVSGGTAAIWTVVEQPTGTVALEPYKYYVCGERAALEITVGDAVSEGKLNEYMFEFDSPAASATILTVPQTLYSPVSLDIQRGKKYIVHIRGRYMTISGGSEGYSYEQDMASQIAGKTATYIKIPYGTTAITRYQFENFLRLKEIDVPPTVRTIAEYAFYGCKELLTFPVPDGVTSIGNYAFYNCESLQEINLPDGLVSLGTYVFQNCKALERIVVPSNIMNVPNFAFYGCVNLTDVTLPSGLTAINASAFQGCTSLEEIDIPQSVNTFGASAFYGSGLRRVQLPPNMTRLENTMFMNCDNLEEIDIPDNVVAIGTTVFSGCTSLVRVAIGSGITTLPSGTFTNTAITEFPTVRGTITSIQGSCFSNCRQLREMVFPEGVTTVNGACFDGCTNLQRVELPTSMQVFGATSVFRNCTALYEVELHDTITTLSVSGSNQSLRLVIHGTNKVIALPTSLNAASRVYVEDSMVDAYKASSAWSATKGRIYPMSEYVA